VTILSEAARTTYDAQQTVTVATSFGTNSVFIIYTNSSIDDHDDNTDNVWCTLNNDVYLYKNIMDLLTKKMYRMPTLFIDREVVLCQFVPSV